MLSEMCFMFIGLDIAPYKRNWTVVFQFHIFKGTVSVISSGNDNIWYNSTLKIFVW